VPTIRTGAQATAGAYAINPDQRQVEMMERVFQYDAPGGPSLTIVTKRAQVMRARSTEPKHLEDDILPEWDQANGQITSGILALVVDNPTYHRIGDILKVVSTGETLLVTGQDVGTSTLTIVRSWGATAAATIPDNAWLLNMGAAEVEGDLSPVAKSTVTVTKTNYTQILRTPVHLTKTLDNQELYGGPERNRQRRKEGARHARLWEQILLHGEKREDLTSGDYPRRSAGGIDEHISTNILATGGVLTEGQFIDFIGDSMRYSVNGGRKRKGLLASRELMSTISSWGNHKIRTNSQASATYGIEVTTYISPHGTLDIIPHPLLENGYAGYGYIIDWDGVWYRPARRTTLNTNIQQPGEDAFKDEWFTEATFSFALEKAFAKITGVTY
jgi:hypothetical protein